MVHALQSLAGVVIAIALDWAIYTHVAAFLRLGILSTPRASYTEVARGRFAALVRTGAVVLSGLLGGLAFALGDVPLWLSAFGLFVLAHTALYVLLYKWNSDSI